MTARLDYQPALQDLTAITTGAPVRSGTWQDAAQSLNYTRAKGGQLIAASQMDYTVTAGTTATFRYRVAPGLLSKGAIWTIALKSPSALGVDATVRVPSTATVAPPFGTVAAHMASPTLTYANAQSYYDTTIVATSYTECELSFSVEAPASSAVVVAWAACVEGPRPYIALDATELGTDIQTLLVGQPIMATTAQSYSSIASCAEAAAVYDGRRRSLFHWYNPTGIATTSTTLALILPDIPALNRKLFLGETERAIRFRVYASAVTNTGVFRLKTSTQTTDVTISTGAAAWYPSTAGAAASLIIDSEDLSEATGLQGGAYKLLTPQSKINTAGTCTIYGLSIFEDPADCA